MKKISKKLLLLLLTVMAVLTVSFGVQAASARTPSRQIDPQGNMTKAMLGVSTNTLTVTNGKARTLVCSFYGSGYLTYNVSNSSIVSCSWGSWYSNGTKVNLTVRGMAVGSTYIYITNSYNSEVKVVKVTVCKNQTLNTSTLTVNKGSTRTVILNLRGGTPYCSVSNTSILSCAKKSSSGASNGSANFAYTIKGKAAGTAYVYFTNSFNGEKTTLKVTVKDNPVTKRAVVVGEVNYPVSKKLPACKNDANAMDSVLRQTGYGTVYKGINVTRAQIRSAISSTFAAADSNDISLFYFSGHGDEYNGALCCISGSYEEDITARELASWLSDVPGTVIVILDTCGSGCVINKAGGASEADLFNASVINAFAEADVFAKNGELCTSKFRVLTACQMNTYSNCTDRYSYFTKALIDGAGFDYTYGTRRSSAPADGNKNGTISLYEAWYYVKNHVDAKLQKAQHYPTQSATTVFKR